MRELATAEAIVIAYNMDKKPIPSFVEKFKWKTNLMKIKFNCIIFKKSSRDQIVSVEFVPENSLWSNLMLAQLWWKYLYFKCPWVQPLLTFPDGSAGGCNLAHTLFLHVPHSRGQLRQETQDQQRRWYELESKEWVGEKVYNAGATQGLWKGGWAGYLPRNSREATWMVLFLLYKKETRELMVSWRQMECKGRVTML